MTNKVATQASQCKAVNKGLGYVNSESPMRLNVARQQVSLPCACIYQSRLDNNIAWMAHFAAQSQVKFSPHGKTTMAPDIFKKQLAAGAYAITVATVHQAWVAAEAGANRIIMANQLVGRANCQFLAELLTQYQVEFYCLVDNVDNAVWLDEFFSAQQLSINVLIELGVAGGRCGVVEPSQLMQVVTTLSHCDFLQLAGVEVYEGVLVNEQGVREFLNHAVSECKRLMLCGAFDTEQIMITAGGSAWYDVVCEAFAPKNLLANMVPVIRPGCYVAHDQGIYEDAQQQVLARNPLACNIGSDLQSCLEIWAYVQSIPEPGRAIIGMGKRDVAFDAGLPTPNLHINQYGDVTAVTAGWHIEKIMDQHAMLHCDPQAKLAVGDIIAFGTSHPCLTFDKWRYINVIDDDFTVIDVIETFF